MAAILPRSCMCFLVVYFVSIPLHLISAVSPSSADMIERPVDVKDFKKLLRTKTNVLVMFANAETNPQIKKWLPICREAAERSFGKATIAFVNCE